MSMQVSYKKQIILGIFLLVILIFVIEGVIRLYEYFEIPCRFAGKDSFSHIDYFTQRQLCIDHTNIIYDEPYELSSVKLSIKPNQHFDTLNINSYGFRGPEIIKDKSDDTYRIFVLGGSTTFGHTSTSDNTTITGYLQKKFNEIKLDKRIEVINGGIGHADSIRELNNIKNKLVDFEPDLFIIYDGWNDSTHLYENKEKLTISNQTDSVEVIDTKQKINKFIYRVLASSRTLFQLNVLTSNQDQQYFMEEKLMQNKYKKLNDVLNNNWAEICTLGEKQDFKTIITIQPLLGTGKNKLSLDENKILSSTLKNQNIIDLVNSIKFSKEVENKCAKTEDLRNIFMDISEPVFYDLGHTTDFGNEIVSQELFETSLPVVKEVIDSNNKTN